ncbi:MULTISPECIES: UDP-N-acetylmuramoyl-tripeptide--D-alanyl-D-alanine ligase [Variovorax]|jgi:UDP-N-acetylmuramoyl-tripeptide--D-alanyl-D-alanine ligase|uniref:UDP-N-acetylmuramoyl-tripeptide--D-alanyl-D- alanine ligase n=1 Tax=Variovorax TaxID=34072 RepID=UPI00086C90EA|nr:MULTISPECIES: UDP-N-acetylmuramoyl-tripeptide--D-alanyl-D-alanine ligase [Variovorax]MBN8756162.1 UDP-N-acetylmuramoyl-tripeptide--D-alanyl-D-alanine ligase [Variovorax sp.]ODU16568.1 MAG: UDP-N-acetylmuramoylalanyl-D-glutamyl-2, 6-diaminopimelate--D-alanyl-D-alanine ligase [Variovorax sp. SCN 67-85]ODV23714.1 MAG: UDP-N-acetylmuramoylalanyl-D-glutamyl-2, 6-diaminopimelate--D-alanyl-D-alanine ligase [Variovorax sp. SCN 67-20]OJZ13047.1 MAG: UDP-N-acetylmuramoylalanyl-D-glutamyl-2, 6-diaminop
MTDSTPLGITLAQAQQWIPGSRLVGDASTVIARVHTDTRTLAAGDLFVALKGERFDANEFLAEAKKQGAVAAIAHHGLEAAGLAGLEVPDSLLALGALGAGWRAQFTLPLIAVTGSNGKTTVTQMIAAVLFAARADRGESALATAGNFNNEIGVPLTLLRLRAQHQRAVLELGMNHPGEIARLAAMSRPTIALVNNAQREHQEFMATVEAVAVENAAVFAVLPDDGTAVFPYGDAFTSLWTDMAHAGGSRRCMTFGEHQDADISLDGAEWKQGAWAVRIRTPIGSFDARLHIAGRHNVVNALAATACALAAGVSTDIIAAGLSAFEPVKGRSRASEIVLADGRAVTLVDDSYNANPDSVIAAIDVLAALPGPRLLVLGDMGEVGERSPEFHAEVGDWARQRGIEAVYTFGNATAHTVAAFRGDADGRHFNEFDALGAAVLARLPHVGSVLVKGSRSMKMERMVQAIAAQARPQQQKEAGHDA